MGVAHFGDTMLDGLNVFKNEVASNAKIVVPKFMQCIDEENKKLNDIKVKTADDAKLNLDGLKGCKNILAQESKLHKLRDSPDPYL